MDQLAKLYLERADNELVLAEAIFQLSSEEAPKKALKIDPKRTFYSSAISTAYYVIFYSAKAYLLSKKIKTPFPGEHQKVYHAFKKLVERGILEQELLTIYNEEMMKAETFLEILGEEKEKRTKFTYQQLPQANKKPATESLENARKFYKHLYSVLNKS